MIYFRLVDSSNDVKRFKSNVFSSLEKNGTLTACCKILLHLIFRKMMEIPIWSIFLITCKNIIVLETNLLVFSLINVRSCQFTQENVEIFIMMIFCHWPSQQHYSSKNYFRLPFVNSRCYKNSWNINSKSMSNITLNCNKVKI